MIKIMEEKTTEVCRLCLLLVRNYESMNATQQDMVQIVVPELVGLSEFFFKVINIIISEFWDM